MVVGRRRLLAWLFAAGVATGATGLDGPSARAEPRAFALNIKQGKVVGAEQTIRVLEGDDVTLTWTSDQTSEVHLHGYDIELEVVPGKPGTMQFVAHATGRFPVSAHGHGEETTLIYFEVHPR